MKTDENLPVLLLASGGLDSTTLGYWLRSQGKPFVILFIDYGQHCAKTEFARLKEVLPESDFGAIARIDISHIYQGTSSRLIKEADLWTEHVDVEDLYLPYRNLLLLSAGAAYAQSRGYSEVYAAFINSNHAKEIDCSAEFFDRLNDIFTDSGSVKVAMPFRAMSKSEVVRLAISLQVPVGRTFSCQVASIVPCGACPNCRDRLDALEGVV